MPRVVLSFLLLPLLCACQEADRPQLIASAHAQSKPVALKDFSYVARLSPLDHLDPEGAEFEGPEQVLRRDRERYYAGLRDPEDEKDGVLSSEEARSRFESMAYEARLDELLLLRNAKVRVTVRRGKLSLEVLDPGDDSVACILVDGRLNHLSWSYPADKIRLARRWEERGWKINKTASAVQVLRPDSQLAATFLRESDGPDALRLEGPTCSTPFGVRIGATLAEAKLDPQIKQAVCNCSDANNIILWASNQAFTYQYRIDATCKKPVKCMASDTDIMCPTAMGRKDCVITAILVQPAAG